MYPLHYSIYTVTVGVISLLVTGVYFFITHIKLLVCWFTETVDFMMFLNLELILVYNVLAE